MKPTTVQVTFRKQIGDGKFGSETAEVSLAATLDEGDGDLVQATWAAHLLDTARRIATIQLSESPSLLIRRALQREEPRQPQADEL